jgi:hypothetical protein
MIYNRVNKEDFMKTKKLKPSQKLMIYIDNFCIYTTVKDLNDKKLLDLLNQLGDSNAIGTNIDGKSVQINLIK